MDTNILDSLDKISEIDKGNVLGSITALPEQIEDGWQQGQSLEIPDNYTNFENIVMCGMGGSGLAARIVETAYSSLLKIPLTRVNDYSIPGFVGKDTLGICSSYSGATEETLDNAKQFADKNAKWIAVGTGGPLSEMAKEKKVPSLELSVKYNPSNQPRMAIGYSLMSQLSILSRLGLLEIESEEIQNLVSELSQNSKSLSPDVAFDANPAKKMAAGVYGKIILFISAEHLTGATHTVNNQFNENAKNLTFDFTIPELNHHLLEGLKNPIQNHDNLIAFIINSSLYSQRVQKRMEITAEVVEKYNIEKVIFTPSTTSVLSQIFELIQFGMYVNFYLSILYDQDPSPIPWVDYFKKRMSE